MEYKKGKDVVRWTSKDALGAYVPSDSIYQDRGGVYRGYAIEELEAYEDADKNGRIVVLPCKRGDIVWRIVGQKGKKTVAPREVLAVTIYSPGEYVIHTDGAENHLGKEVFLSEEEAKMALIGTIK